jgi:hypothetical protein
MGMLLVERPFLFPAFFCLGIAWFMLLHMHSRQQSPSPWHRSFSFVHYLRILVLGHSVQVFERVEPQQGWEEQKAAEIALQERIDEDKIFFEQRDAAEKVLEEIEKLSLQTKTRAIPIEPELLVVLGKLQGVVGGT